VTKLKIITIFVIVELAIIGAVIWAAFHHLPARRYLLTAILLFSLNGLWLVWMTVKNTPQR